MYNVCLCTGVPITRCIVGGICAAMTMRVSTYPPDFEFGRALLFTSLSFCIMFYVVRFPPANDVPARVKGRDVRRSWNEKVQRGRCTDETKSRNEFVSFENDRKNDRTRRHVPFSRNPLRVARMGGGAMAKPSSSIGNTGTV